MNWLDPDTDRDRSKLRAFLSRLPPIVAEIRASYAASVEAQGTKPPPPGFPPIETEDECIAFGLTVRCSMRSVTGAPNLISVADWLQIKALIEG